MVNKDLERREVQELVEYIVSTPEYDGDQFSSGLHGYCFGFVRPLFTAIEKGAVTYGSTHLERILKDARGFYSSQDDWRKSAQLEEMIAALDRTAYWQLVDKKYGDVTLTDTEAQRLAKTGMQLDMVDTHL